MIFIAFIVAYTLLHAPTLRHRHIYLPTKCDQPRQYIYQFKATTQISLWFIL